MLRMIIWLSFSDVFFLISNNWLIFRALDFCYHEESDSVTLLEIVDMCVTVVAYSADSKRGHQMLVGCAFLCIFFYQSFCVFLSFYFCLCGCVFWYVICVYFYILVFWISVFLLSCLLFNLVIILIDLILSLLRL